MLIKEFVLVKMETQLSLSKKEKRQQVPFHIAHAGPPILWCNALCKHKKGVGGFNFWRKENLVVVVMWTKNVCRVLLITCAKHMLPNANGVISLLWNDWRDFDDTLNKCMYIFPINYFGWKDTRKPRVDHMLRNYQSNGAVSWRLELD